MLMVTTRSDPGFSRLHRQVGFVKLLSKSVLTCGSSSAFELNCVFFLRIDFGSWLDLGVLGFEDNSSIKGLFD